MPAGASPLSSIRSLRQGHPHKLGQWTQRRPWAAHTTSQQLVTVPLATQQEHEREACQWLGALASRRQPGLREMEALNLASAIAARLSAWKVRPVRETLARAAMAAARREGQQLALLQGKEAWKW